MNYGYFDDRNKEYVITNPKTPFPWINYLGNEDFFGLISNTADGYAFYKDTKFRPLMSYCHNNAPMDNGGRYFYIKDAGCVWDHGWKPVKTPLDRYERRHGLNYSKITGVKNSVKAETTFFIPLKARAEIHWVKLTNDSNQVKKLKSFSFVEWCLWNAEDDQNNLQRNLSAGEVEIDGAVFYHKTEYKELRNHYAYYGVNSKPDGFDTDREKFVGLYNELSEPEAVIEGFPRNSQAHAWSPIASHYLEITLTTGDTKDLIFVLGYLENTEDDKLGSKDRINKTSAKIIPEKFIFADEFEVALADLEKYWESLLSVIHIDSSDDKLDRMVNNWNQYQCMVTFNMSRSVSFFEVEIGRGMGFCNSNQDLISFVHKKTERARERIIDIASSQFLDGAHYLQYQPFTKRGNYTTGSDFTDDSLWLILGTVCYIKETVDFSILNESLAKTLFGHLTILLNHVMNNWGSNGLPLIYRADWNDCPNLNCFSTTPNESFQTTETITEGSKTESVMIVGWFVVLELAILNFANKLEKNRKQPRRATR